MFQNISFDYNSLHSPVLRTAGTGCQKRGVCLTRARHSSSGLVGVASEPETAWTQSVAGPARNNFITAKNALRPKYLENRAEVSLADKSKLKYYFPWLKMVTMIQNNISPEQFPGISWEQAVNKRISRGVERSQTLYECGHRCTGRWRRDQTKHLNLSRFFIKHNILWRIKF